MSTDIEKGKTEPQAGSVDSDAAAQTDGPAPSASVLKGQKRMQQTQAQVDEVTEIMRMNVEKVLERDGMISALDERADALKEGSEMFQRQSAALKSKFWWENMKMIGIMVAIGIIFVLVFFVWLS